MSFDNYDYRIHSLAPAQPGWQSIGQEPTSSTADIRLVTFPVACWAVATYPLDGDGAPFDQPVGLITTSDSLGPLEAEDDYLALGYCAPGETAEKFREAALRKTKLRLRRATHVQRTAGY